MTRASKVVRGLQILLAIAGICLLGTALAATESRRSYQAQQERALFQRGPAISAQPVVAVEQPPSVTPPEMPAPVVSREQVKKEAPTPVVPDPTAFARLEIPRLGLSAIVKEGVDEGTLSRAVGLVPASPRPGEGGNVVLAGHRDTFFRPLRNIKVSDRIRMLVPPNTYEYEVQTVRVVEPADTAVLESRGVEELTLVTCFPFRLIGPAPDRFIVTATRVN